MTTINETILKKLNFDNQILRCLPIDPIEDNYVRTVRNACYSLVNPTPLDNPRLVCYSRSALNLLDIFANDSIDNDRYFIECFAGNQLISGSQPASHCYCGHQFGDFAGQLGDGAAIYLGEIINARNERWELQLKGAGPTPYSRDADGRKVLRSSLREFLCSEAMHNLGIATTRAATCIVSDTKVIRDQFYDGNPKSEPCAVISRIAPTFLRFGSYEIIRPLDQRTGRCGPSVGNHQLLRNMVDFTIQTYFNDIKDDTEKYKRFFCDVVKRTATLVAGWQAFGFVHGVLNTDNMSILGLTIDYGPFGFMERYDPDHISNTSDHDGRYCYRKQPDICHWNLLKLAEIFKSLTPFEELKGILDETYFKIYKKEYISLMRKKLGLKAIIDDEDKNIIDENLMMSDKNLIEKFLQTLNYVGGDYTNCFRALSILRLPEMQNIDELNSKLLEQSSSLSETKKFYEKYLRSPMVFMNIIVLQNFSENNEHLRSNDDIIQVLKKIEHYKKIEEMNETQYREECERHWNEWLDLYIKRLQYEIKDLNDSNKIIEYDQSRRALMNSVNPKYILRNHLAQKAIEMAEQHDDFSGARFLLKILENPFEDDPNIDDYYCQRSPPSLCDLRVSCSS